MSALLAEIIKLRRSLALAVVVLLPLVLVLTGSAMTLLSGRPLDDGWHTLWLRSFVFYGLFPLPVGIAILASLVWRPEHVGTNWNSLMSGPTPSWRIVVAKTGAVALMAVAMQVVALATVVALGTLAFRLPGGLPPRYLVASVMIALAGVPVAALQSALSMLIRSFAGPVAIAFFGAGISAVLVKGVPALVLVSPYAALTRATQLGTGAFADDGAVTGTPVALIAAATVVLTAVVTAAATRVLERGDART